MTVMNPKLQIHTALEGTAKKYVPLRGGEIHEPVFFGGKFIE